MRVAFRVEGEPDIGLGHVMRCLALAQSLIKCGHEVFFFMSQASQHFCLNRDDWIGEILPIEDVDTKAEPAWLIKQSLDLQIDWLLLDGYQFEQSYRHSLQSIKFKLALFDDMNNSGPLNVDLVINGAPNADLLNYQLTAPNALFAIGQGYQVLRQEFLESPSNEWSDRKNLTVMFGGSDPKKLTIKTLHSLQKLNASMRITVITGAAYSELQKLADFIKNSNLRIRHLHDCQNMASELINSKLVLSAAGGSQFELLACKTPSILVVVADNQINASQEAASQDWCQVVKTNKLDTDDLAMQCLSLWQQPELLRKMHEKALAFPVIDGGKNIVRLMSGQHPTVDKTQ
jgi:UDP-2,4-diacetamido-2,4,6-trideoxy-beta-L-altropyranose hydrolase